MDSVNREDILKMSTFYLIILFEQFSLSLYHTRIIESSSHSFKKFRLVSMRINVPDFSQIAEKFLPSMSIRFYGNIVQSLFDPIREGSLNIL
jgi:hypothetical protein